VLAVNLAHLTKQFHAQLPKGHGQSERGKNGPTDMRESDRLIVEA